MRPWRRRSPPVSSGKPASLKAKKAENRTGEEAQFQNRAVPARGLCKQHLAVEHSRTRTPRISPKPRNRSGVLTCPRPGMLHEEGPNLVEHRDRASFRSQIQLTPRDDHGGTADLRRDQRPALDLYLQPRSGWAVPSRIPCSMKTSWVPSPQGLVFHQGPGEGCGSRARSGIFRDAHGRGEHAGMEGVVRMNRAAAIDIDVPPCPRRQTLRRNAGVGQAFSTASRDASGIRSKGTPAECRLGAWRSKPISDGSSPSASAINSAEGPSPRYCGRRGSLNRAKPRSGPRFSATQGTMPMRSSRPKA